MLATIFIRNFLLNDIYKKKIMIYSISHNIEVYCFYGFWIHFVKLSPGLTYRLSFRIQIKKISISTAALGKQRRWRITFCLSLWINIHLIKIFCSSSVFYCFVCKFTGKAWKKTRFKDFLRQFQVASNEIKEFKWN